MKKNTARGIPWRTIAAMAVVGALAILLAWRLESNPRLNGSARDTESALRISEVMSDTDDVSVDWIEIENAGETEISLYGYALVNAAEPKKAFVFPSRTIAPGEYLVVLADGTNTAERNGSFHAPFRLSSGSETIYLLNKSGSTIDCVDVPGLGRDQVYCRDESGEWTLSYAATPGAKNEIADLDDIRSQSRLAIPGSVEISEVSSKNRSYFPDENGEFHDYVELHNASDEEVSLAGWYLSNARESLRRWALPAIVLAPGEYRAIHLSGLNRASDEHMHANFRLPASGAEVYLTEPDGTLTSQVTVPALEADQACSLTESGWTTALAPTPGEANSIAGASAIDAR